MKAEDAKLLKELQKQNDRLKKLLVEAELERAALKELAMETSQPGPVPQHHQLLIPTPCPGDHQRWEEGAQHDHAPLSTGILQSG